LVNFVIYDAEVLLISDRATEVTHPPLVRTTMDRQDMQSRLGQERSSQEENSPEPNSVQYIGGGCTFL